MYRLMLRRLLLGVAFLFVFAGLHAQENQITPSTAMEAYLDNGDLTYRWEVREHQVMDNLKIYDLLLVSQKWQDLVWTHQLTILVPDQLTASEALLMITGGTVKEGMPDWVPVTKQDGMLAQVADIAVQNGAVTALVRQVPNQPLFGDLSEDALISYTLHNFQKDGDYTWPLLFPMTKSAIRAMDAVTEFCAEQLQRKLTGFVVAGGSKRGWTTWLAAEQDERVIGAAPMVIDVLNMPKSLKYQVETFGGYSEQIRDYTDLGILEALTSGKGRALVEMIDPYSYRQRATMPKLLIMATNDPFWATDNVKNYIDSIPGVNRLRYVPNVGHDLGGAGEAMQTLGVFFGVLLSDNTLPTCTWKAGVTGKDLEIQVDVTRDQLLGVELWSTVSESRDFRKAVWEISEVALPDGGVLSVRVPLPALGYGACYVDLKYKAPDGEEYKLSTRIFTTSPTKLL